MSDEYTGPHTRAADQSLAWRVSRAYAKWSWIITPVGFTAALLGLRVVGPQTGIDRLTSRQDRFEMRVEAQFDTVKMRQDASYNDRADTRKMIEFIARKQCTEMTQHERTRLGGDDVCYAAEHPLDHAIKAKIRAPMEPVQ